MVGVSYHELTAGNPQAARHTAGQRKQFLLICVVGVAVCANAFINAGLFDSVTIKDDGIYPGGDFIYKLIENKDYASTGGIWRRIGTDLQREESTPTLNLDGSNNEQEEIKYDNSLYCVYVDKIVGGFGRFMCGILIDKSQSDLKDRLLGTNKRAEELMIKYNEGKEGYDDNSEKQFLRQKYLVGDLPSVRAAVARFPFTDGFTSALLHNYKVFPALYKYAKANLDPKSKIVISTSCNRDLKMCHHYIPMKDSEAFLLNHPDTDEYLKNLPKEAKTDFNVYFKGVKKLLGFK
jgi:hypothetical protein